MSTRPVAVPLGPGWRDDDAMNVAIEFDEVSKGDGETVASLILEVEDFDGSPVTTVGVELTAGDLRHLVGVFTDRLLKLALERP